MPEEGSGTGGVGSGVVGVMGAESIYALEFMELLLSNEGIISSNRSCNQYTGID